MPKPKPLRPNKPIVNPPPNLPITRQNLFTRWNEFPAHREVHWLTAIVVAWGAVLIFLSGLIGMRKESELPMATVNVRCPATRCLNEFQPQGQVLGEETVREPVESFRPITDDVQPKPFSNVDSTQFGQ